MTFDDVASATKALNKLDGQEVDGFNIGLRYAEDRPRDGGSAGRGSAGGGRGRGGRGGGRGEAWRVYGCCVLVVCSNSSTPLLCAGRGRGGGTPASKRGSIQDFKGSKITFGDSD